ncbi:fatty acid synthase alpha subunit FasA [Lophiotrema nucula]|uniref:Fatty acid synthase subunit alpha n=1 Tax=Lophiotrema nucula TaxID=690887 RepID=A0A6A5YNN3_9PLEO|nr:fatty acid synthase alpha subunit FasA [Lophiotrema nucula]
MTQKVVSQSEDALARTLLIELLSIETQDHLLGAADARRIVEIGPSKVLTTLAQKTWKKKFAEHDTFNSRTRTFLSHSSDSAALEYEYQTPEEEPQTAKEPPQEAATASHVAVQPVPNPESQSQRAPVVVQDTPLKAVDLVTVIVAQKLKKPFDQVSFDVSIRDLCQGKSTLQNEIVGDLGAEFSSLPSDTEDHSITALSAVLERNFNESIGKHVSGLTSRLISSKMPGGFNQAAIKAHLESYWGLGVQRQKAIMCAAVTVQPAERLQSVDAAKEYFNGVATRYSAFSGTPLSPGGSGPQSANAAQSLTIDAEGLKALNAKGDEYLTRQHELLSRHLGIDATVSDRALEELQQAKDVLADELGHWTEEFDEKFLAGIKPTFEASKIRSFDSWWNWARTDLFNTLLKGAEAFQDRDTVRNLLNRWDPSCTAILKHFITAQSSHALNIPKDIGALLADVALTRRPVFKCNIVPKAPITTISAEGEISYSEIDRKLPGSACSYPELLASGSTDPRTGDRVPYVHLRRKDGDDWKYDVESTWGLLNVIRQCVSMGINFSGKTALVTGAGPGSIGFEVVQALLKGGARVLVTTSRPPAISAPPYNELYRKYGAAGSELVILPFNQASARDCEALIKHIYSSSSYGGDIDFVIPFAAIPETGREIDNINAHSELAHRMMLTNTLRLLGHIKMQKEQRGIATKPTTVLLPLSPNHGTFGGDGLYSESKLGLETLFNRFRSERWSAYLSICGAVIGWTRGTGLMSGNNIVAEAVEKSGRAITFTQSEMALNIIALLSEPISQLCEDEPLYADLNGGVHLIPDLKGTLLRARQNITNESRLRKALTAERNIEDELLGRIAESAPPAAIPRPRANIQFNFPQLLEHKNIVATAPDLQGMIDLSRAVVVVGFSELGPWGSSRTRWEMEKDGALSIEGYCEMAWIMGLIKHADLEGKTHIGWVDAQTNEPVHDADVGRIYGEAILNHTGIRRIEPEGLGGYDPEKKELLHEVVVKEDLPAFEASKEVAQAFTLKHGDGVQVRKLGEDEFEVQVKQGARFFVPKAIEFDRAVAGQLPKGWDARRYGVPDDIITQTDPMTLYVLCCVNEALLSAGFHDPFEIWQHIHVSELANCVGTGAGSLLALRNVYRERYLDRSVQNDVLQESFGNAMDAWTNMLLLASAGPIKSPSGTCATAVESLDIACEGIRSGQVKMAIVGGSDDLQEEMSYEFGQMKATASSVEAMSQGRLPKEMSRPTASSRSGFVESAGCGVQILMNAELALKIGAPIHAIVGYTQMAGDKIGRSVPAPGQGILTAAREDKRASTSKILDLDFRRSQLRQEASQIHEWSKAQLAASDDSSDSVNWIHSTVAAKFKAAQNLWSNDLRAQDPRISPIKAALATWGLTIDDIGFASFHGTSTKANDKNESDVINKMMKHLGRSIGHPVPVVCQKYLTGHPKGAAAAWMLNGSLQVFQSGCIPGNRNADNVDIALRAFEHLVYPARTLQGSSPSAFMLTSFGFGQKGGLVVGISPKYLFAAISRDTYQAYRSKVLQRQHIANSMLNEGLMDMNMFKAKRDSPWKAQEESTVFLDPSARACCSDDGKLSIVTNTAENQEADHSLDRPSSLDLSYASQTWIEKTVSSLGPQPGIGVDIESFDSIDTSNDVFMRRNFTEAERLYCQAAPDPRASLTGRWAAKEAVFKSLGVKSKGAGAAMKEIEILSEAGRPIVKLHGEARAVATERGLGNIEVSITHEAELAMAVALASRAVTVSSSASQCSPSSCEKWQEIDDW